MDFLRQIVSLKYQPSEPQILTTQSMKQTYNRYTAVMDLLT